MVGVADTDLSQRGEQLSHHAGTVGVVVCPQPVAIFSTGPVRQPLKIMGGCCRKLIQRCCPDENGCPDDRKRPTDYSSFQALQPFDPPSQNNTVGETEWLEILDAEWLETKRLQRGRRIEIVRRDLEQLCQQQKRLKRELADHLARFREFVINSPERKPQDARKADICAEPTCGRGLRWKDVGEQRNHCTFCGFTFCDRHIDKNLSGQDTSLSTHPLQKHGVPRTVSGHPQWEKSGNRERMPLGHVLPRDKRTKFCTTCFERYERCRQWLEHVHNIPADHLGDSQLTGVWVETLGEDLAEIFGHDHDKIQTRVTELHDLHSVAVRYAEFLKPRRDFETLLEPIAILLSDEELRKPDTQEMLQRISDSIVRECVLDGVYQEPFSVLLNDEELRNDGDFLANLKILSDEVRDRTSGAAAEAEDSSNVPDSVKAASSALSDRTNALKRLEETTARLLATEEEKYLQMLLATARKGGF